MMTCLADIAVTAPLYRTPPHEIAISQIGMRVFDLEWMLQYLRSFYRLGTNRPDGFSKCAIGPAGYRGSMERFGPPNNFKANVAASR